MWHGKIYAHFAKNTNSHFDYPRIPIGIWPEVGTLSFEKGCSWECVESNRCIPQGYRLVLYLAFQDWHVAPANIYIDDKCN